jgi:hypothetical protein
MPGNWVEGTKKTPPEAMVIVTFSRTVIVD